MTCHFSDFGYELTSGRWPARPGEVVATSNLPFGLGVEVRGVTPTELRVVGTATNRNSFSEASLLVAAGTWLSWDMASNGEKFPRLESTYTVYFNTDDLLGVKTSLAQFAAESEAANFVEIMDVSDSRSSTIQRFPFLFIWLLWPLAFISTGASLATRFRLVSRSVAALVSHGIEQARAQRVVALSSTIWMLFVTPIAVAAGWMVAIALKPLVELASKQPAGSIPLPLDVMVTFMAAPLLVLLVGAGLKSFRFTGRRKRRNRQAARQTFSARKGLIGAFLLVATIGSLPIIGNVNDVFALFFVLLAVVAWFTPEATRLSANLLRVDRLSTKYAVKRIRGSGSKSWFAMTATMVGLGPFIALSILISSTISSSNDNELLPPDVNQAVFYPAEQQSIDSKVLDIVADATADSVVAVPVSMPTQNSGFGVVSNPDGTGAIYSVDSVAALEKLLGQKISSDAASVLKSSGVLWLRENLGAEVWLISSQSVEPLEVESSYFEASSPRWANQSAGFLLAETVEDLGLQNLPAMWVLVDVNPERQESITQGLVGAGFDASYIRFPRDPNPFEVTPFQLALGAGLGLVGVTLLGVSLRTSVRQIRTNADNLLSLGISRGWFGRVMMIEVGYPAAIGLVLGSLIPIAYISASIASLRIPMVVPWDLLLEALGVCLVIFGLIFLLGLRALLKRA